MRKSSTILFPLFLTTLLGQPADTGTAHKAAATALLNSNNKGAAGLACPATIGAVSTANSPAGPGAAKGGPGAAKGPGAEKGAGPRPDPPKENWYAEGGKVFDNLYMLTTKVNSAWAVKTSQGIILIDTLFGYAAEESIVNELKRAGLNPADIKYIIVSHAHGDHDGAVKFLRAPSAAFAASAAALMAASVLVILGSKDFVPEGVCAMSTDPHHPNAMMRTAADRTKIRLPIRSLLVLSAPSIA